MSSLGIFNKETQSYQKIAGSTGAAMLDTEMSDTSVNPVQNKVIKKYVDSKQVEVDVASKDNAGIVKPTDGLVVAEDGSLKVNLDGTTLTMDQVNNVIKLADTLKEKIIGALPAANVVNNLTTTEAGFALDARQGNPSIKDTLAKQIRDIIYGQIGLHNPVLDLNNFYNGIGIFNAEVANVPAKEWVLVVSAGPSGTRLQIAWTLFGANNYYRHQASGSWEEWEQLDQKTVSIHDKENMNDDKFFEPGKYYCPYNVIAATLSNAPFATAFFMEVYDPTNVNQYIAQRATEFNTGHCKYRIRDNGNKRVDAWIQLY